LNIKFYVITYLDSTLLINPHSYRIPLESLVNESIIIIRREYRLGIVRLIRVFGGKKSPQVFFSEDFCEMGLEAFVFAAFMLVGFD
jgi:hypothetical protein